MDEIKRYDAVCMGYDDARFEEEPEGEWVTYSDHKAALADKEAELQAEREKVSRYNLAVKAIHDVDDIAEFQKQLTAEAEKMDREELTAYYLCTMSNWAIVLYERDKAEAELSDLRGRLEGASECLASIKEYFDKSPWRYQGKIMKMVDEAIQSAAQKDAKG